MADVFLSYSSKDAALVARIEALLVARGLTVWFDRALASGEDLRREIAKQIDAAKAVLVLWTPHSLRSDWVRSEADRGQRLGKLLQARLASVPLEAIPQPFDVYHVPEIDNVDAILRGVAMKLANERRLVTTPAPKAAAPIRIGEAVLSLTRPHRCFGRDADIDKLVEAMLPRLPPARGWLARLLSRDPAKQKQTHRSSIIVYGGPGLGKTTLTRMVAVDDRLAGRFGSRRYFISLEGKATAADFVETIGAELRPSQVAPSGGSLREILASLSTEPHLLVLDNLETPLQGDAAAVEKELATLDAFPQISIIASLRGRGVPAKPHWSLRLELKPLDEPSSTTLFKSLAPSISDDDPHLTGMIAALGGVPLAIELVAHEAANFTSLEFVWSEWTRVGTAVARRTGTALDRLSSFDASVELSVSSPSRLPGAMTMLSTIGRLEGGADMALLEAMFGAKTYALAQDLTRSGLAFQAEHRLDALPPIREYAVRRFPLDNTEEGKISSYYLAAAKRLEAGSTQLTEASVKRSILAEQANLARVFAQNFHKIPITDMAKALGTVITACNSMPRETPGAAAAVIRFHSVSHAFYAYHAAMAYVRGHHALSYAFNLCSIRHSELVVETMRGTMTSIYDDIEKIASEVPRSDRRIILDAVKEMRKELNDVETQVPTPRWLELRRQRRAEDDLLLAALWDRDFLSVTVPSPADREFAEADGVFFNLWVAAMRALANRGVDVYYSAILVEGYDHGTWKDEELDYGNLVELQLADMQTTGDKSDDSVHFAFRLMRNHHAQDVVRTRSRCWLDAAAKLGDGLTSDLMAEIPLREKLDRALEGATPTQKKEAWAEFACAVEGLETARHGKPGTRTADAVGSSAFEALLEREFKTALGLSVRARAVVPQIMWPETNRAHALMFLGNTREALEIHKQNAKRRLEDGRTWEDTIADDLAVFAEKKIEHKSIREVEKLLQLQTIRVRLEGHKEDNNKSVLQADAKRTVARGIEALRAGDDATATQHFEAARTIDERSAVPIARLLVREAARLNDADPASPENAGLARSRATLALVWSARQELARQHRGPALFEHGRALRVLGLWREAADAFQGAVELDVPLARGWLWWATMDAAYDQIQRGDYESGFLKAWAYSVALPSGTLAELDLHDAMSYWAGATSVASLFAHLGPSYVAEPPTAADLLASSINDPQRAAPAVKFENIDTVAAIAAADELLLVDPTDARLCFLRSRARLRAGEVIAEQDGKAAAEHFAKAIADATQAKALGYLAADILLARIHLMGLGVPKDAAKAAESLCTHANGAIRHCAPRIARHLLRSMSIAKPLARTIAADLLAWAAALGNAEADVTRQELGLGSEHTSIAISGTASLTDWPPWLVSRET